MIQFIVAIVFERLGCLEVAAFLRVITLNSFYYHLWVAVRCTVAIILDWLFLIHNSCHALYVAPEI